MFIIHFIYTYAYTYMHICGYIVTIYSVLKFMKYYVIIRENNIKLHVLLWENLLTEKKAYI